METFLLIALVYLIAAIILSPISMEIAEDYFSVQEKIVSRNEYSAVKFYFLVIQSIILQAFCCIILCIPSLLLAIGFLLFIGLAMIETAGPAELTDET